ncbi:hypothetical protein EPO17_02290 [Patescibacteria group bacterium]|nr:MAG: hypothetical protein EPO17_02290 [Patescibacteria group bacterium]
MTGTIFQKIISSILIFFFVFSSTFFIQTQRAEAILGVGDIVFDPTNTVQNTVTATSATATSISQYAIQYKEFVLDGIANYIAKAILRQLTTSVVNWINSGFEGNPSFVTDPAGFFVNIADQEIGKFIEGSSDLNFLCSPFRIDVRVALAFQYSPFKKRVTCTFSDSVKNLGNAVDGASINGRSFTKGNFKNGGWNNWLTLTTQPQNNVYGATLMAQEELSLRVANKQVLGKDELSQGRGFLSFKKCDGVNSEEAALARNDVADAKNRKDDEDLYVAKSELKKAENTGCKTVTPGSVIEGQLGKVLGSSIDNLGLADEFNEIVNALFAQLVNQVVGGGGGLKGASQPTYDGSSYLDKLGAAQDVDTLKNIDERGRQGIDKSLVTVGNYREAKQASLNAVLGAESKLNQLITCYETKASTSQTPPLGASEIATATLRSAEARGTMQANIDGQKTTLQNDLTAVNSVLGRLQLIKSRINATESLDDTLKATSDYQAMLTSKGSDRLYTEIDVSEANTQKETVSATMNTLSTETDRKLTECASFPAVSLLRP